MKLGIISDTHITTNSDEKIVNSLVNQIKKIFNGVDKIIHAGDICDQFFLDELEKVAEVLCVRGDCDVIEKLEDFVKFSFNRYNIGAIHELPDNLEDFMKIHELNIIIFGHTHTPLIKGTNDILLLNPGSPIKPRAPPQKPGFLTPVARPTVITFNIDEGDILSTFIVTLRF